MKKILLYILTILMICVSCAKHTESKLVGEWMVQTVGDCGWQDDAKWTFYSDGTLTIHHDAHLTGDSTYSGSYEVFTRSLVTPYIRIKGLGDLSGNGIWRVEKCNNKKLIINRVEWLNGDTQGAFLRREFLK